LLAVSIVGEYTNGLLVIILLGNTQPLDSYLPTPLVTLKSLIYPVNALVPPFLAPIVIGVVGATYVVRSNVLATLVPFTQAVVYEFDLDTAMCVQAFATMFESASINTSVLA
jgi:hypothetical protein